MLPLELEEPVRLEMTEQLNQLLADTMTLRDLYKKSHWQVAGPTFYQLHLLYDKHYAEQVELVDSIAERIQLLGGVSLAMAPDVAETTQIERPPRGREEVPVQLSRLVDAHQIIIRQTRKLSRRSSAVGDDGTNDLLVSQVLRTNEFQVWFLSEHLVNVPLVKARPGQGRRVATRRKPAEGSFATPIYPLRAADSACLFRRTNSSRLNGKFAVVPRSSAPPAAEKTDRSRGAFTPKATVIVSAKVVRRTPLNKAVMRVFQPRTSRSPKRVSAAVAIIANAGIVAAGKNHFSLAV